MVDATPREIRALIESAVKEEQAAHMRYIAAQAMTLGTVWLYLHSIGIFPGTLCNVKFKNGIEPCIFEGCLIERWLTENETIAIGLRHFTAKGKPRADVSRHKMSIIFDMARSDKAERDFPKRT